MCGPSFLMWLLLPFCLCTWCYVVISLHYLWVVSWPEPYIWLTCSFCSLFTAPLENLPLRFSWGFLWCRTNWQCYISLQLHVGAFDCHHCLLICFHTADCTTFHSTSTVFLSELGCINVFVLPHHRWVSATLTHLIISSIYLLTAVCKVISNAAAEIR